MVNKEVVYLNRDCMGLMVPSGARILLHKGTEVTITQALGNSYTVTIYGNLARIDSKDADALGKAAQNPLSDLPENASVEDQVWAQLKTVYDPEIPVNIVDLGLVYQCGVKALPEGGHYVHVIMTLTAPGCGMGPVIAGDAKQRVLALPDVNDAEVEIVFAPPWVQGLRQDSAKLELGMI